MADTPIADALRRIAATLRRLCRNQLHSGKATKSAALPDGPSSAQGQRSTKRFDSTVERWLNSDLKSPD